MSTPEPNKSSRLTTRITDIERQIRRKMGALAQHVAHTELLEESSIQKTEQLKTIVEERLSEIDLLGMQLQDTAASLRRIADQDQKQWIAELESELFSVERALEQTEKILEIGDLLETTEACQDDRKSALVYLQHIEGICRKLDTWSSGRLRIVKSVGQYLVNKRYTLETEQRKSLKDFKEGSKKECQEDVEEDFGAGDVETDGASAFLEKVRDVLRKPLEPTEELVSEDFGGPGDVNPCRVSFWLRPLVVEILDSPKLSLALTLYTSFYTHTAPSLTDKEVAIVYCNSMFIAHKILLHCLLHQSTRVPLDSAIVLRRFADAMFYERLQKVEFDSVRRTRSSSLDDDAFKKYPTFLSQYCADLREVLPCNISEKVNRLLIEPYVSSLIGAVLQNEDIESSQADRWAALLSDVLAEVKGIAGTVDIRLLPKAEELRNVLSYNLRDFASQWENPNSQLRTWCQPSEVAHLVKAIFQNSPMRSSVLAQIK